MLPFAMNPLASRRSVFAACILAIGGMAADPDGGTDAAAAEDASPEAAVADASPASTPDATVADGSGESPEAASDDGALMSDVPQYVQPDGALPVYTGGNIYDLLCVQDPGVVPFDFSAIQPPYTTAAQCKAFDPSQGHPTARACLCDNCFSLQQQCDALPGCEDIQKCGFDTGCTDADSCYLVGMKCVTQINNWGTGSVATALSQLLDTCGQAANPACPAQ
jgi:hypothetical protein